MCVERAGLSGDVVRFSRRGPPRHRVFQMGGAHRSAVGHVLDGGRRSGLRPSDLAQAPRFGSSNSAIAAETSHAIPSGP